jgi:5-methylcytosine-specific restriction endonuclease McrA
MREYMNRRYYQRREEAIAQLGGKCAQCGSIEGLEIDHIDRSAKSVNVARILTHSRAKVAEELAKCQLLCADCHTLKSKSERYGKPETKHGSVWMYKKFGCRCDECVEASKSYYREYNAKRRAMKALAV